LENQNYSGNEALAKGVYDAGVRIATGYPGSPSTRFIEHLAEISGEKVYVEWSANEKVAFEIALGGSMSGARTAVCFKCVGLNVAMDPLMVANLAGVVGGMLIVLGDDPGARGSQNEQDGRILARAAEIPVLEFSSPQEAYDMARFAFELSEEFHLPVMIRETRAGSEERGRVNTYGKRLERPNIPFSKTADWKNLPIRHLDKHRELHAKIRKISGEFDEAPFNQATFEGSTGIIGVGYASRKVSRLLSEGEADSLSFLKLGTVHPPPDRFILKYLREMERVLVVEEVKPLIERYVRSLALINHLNLEVHGRDTGHLPPCGDILREDLLGGIARSLGYEVPTDFVWEEDARPPSILDEQLPDECPYYHAFEAFSAVMPEDPEERPIFIGDEGCLMKLKNEPFRMLDTKFCMGASIGMASGLALGGERRRVISLMGDSSFFHTGLPSFINAVANDANIVIIILNNGTTALTGCQNHPGTDMDTRGKRRRGIDIEKVARSSGVKDLHVLDAFKDRDRAKEVFKHVLEEEGLKVIIVDGTCTKLLEGSCG
jgi:indolepyruvate ferredoxin oxidoreductase alpha subunit